MRRLWHPFALALALLAPAAAPLGCAEATARPDGGPPDAGPSIAAGVVAVAACAGIDGIDETCSWEYRYDESACAAGAPCDSLVLFFAGGRQDCAPVHAMLSGYVEGGHVTACVKLFETSDGTALEPYAHEAPRVDAVLQSIAAASVIGEVWSGAHLLLSGVSHGATAPVVAMARTTLDDGPHWHGSVSTAACFFDGIYDIAALDELLGTGDEGGPCGLPVSHARLIGRYYPSPPLIHGCVNDKCACDPDHAPEMDDDTIVGVAPSEFAIAHWKLIECGSATPACTGDIVPGPPIESLCQSLESSPAHDCAFESMADDSHLVCASLGVDRCRAWFEARIAALP